MSYSIEHENHEIHCTNKNKSVYIDLVKCIEIIWQSEHHRETAIANMKEITYNDPKISEQMSKLDNHKIGYKKFFISFSQLTDVLRTICDESEEAQNLCDKFTATTIEGIRQEIIKLNKEEIDLSLGKLRYRDDWSDITNLLFESD